MASPFITEILLKDWERVQDIMVKIDIIVAHRTGAEPLAGSIQQLEQALSTSLDWDEQRTRYANANFSMYPLMSELLDISSSELRKNLRHNQALHEVPPAVKDFLRRSKKILAQALLKMSLACLLKHTTHTS